MKQNYIILFLSLFLYSTYGLAQVVTPAGPVAFCAGTTQVLTVAPMAGATYQWTLGGGIIATATGTTYTVSSSGSYACNVTVAGTTSTSNTVVATQKPTPSASVTITTGSASFCTGGTATLTANMGAGYTYQWQRNGVNTSSTLIDQVVSTSGVYTCIVTLNGCDNTSNPISITVNTPPTAAIAAAGATSVCVGNTVVLNATTTGTALTYQWQLSGTDIPGEVAATYAATATGNYSCIVTQNGCVDVSNVISATIKPNPTATITPSAAQSICSGSSVLLTANAGAGITYQWKLNGANIPTATSQTYTATASGNHTCELTLNGCTATAAPVIITVNVPPTATITTTTSNSFCAGGSVLISANIGVGLSYQWQLNAANISGANAATYTATATGSYTCIVTRNSCPTTSNAIAVTANALPVATIAAGGPTTICAGSTITLSANTGAGLTYQWQLNGANIASATASTYPTTAAGNYTCIVTQNGCNNTSNTITITVNPLPVASISAATSTTICAGTSVNLNATAVAGASYQWQQNGVNISGATAVTYAANAAGSYTCIFTQNGCSNASNALTITVNPLPTATITAAGTITVCVGTTVTLNANAGAGLTYQWRLNASNISAATSPSYSASLSGNYTCVTTQNGCNNTSNTIIVTVNTPPVASISPSGPTTFAAPGSVVLSANSGAGLSYQWVLNGVNILGANSVTYLANSTGNYQCIVTQNGCSDISTPITVTVTSTTATITASGPTTICAGNTLNLTASTGTAYQWQLNGANISGANAAIYQVIGAGSFTCLITSGVVIVSNVITVVINPNPTATITPTATQTICAGSATVFTANAGVGLTYQWQLNGISISGANGISYPANAAGNYRCVVTRSGCSIASSASTLVVNPRPTATITPAGSTMLCTGNSLTLNANTNAAFAYQWRLNGTPISGATASSFVASAAGSYSCIVTQGSCADTSSIIPITINTPPTASVAAGSSTTFFSTDSVVLSANTGAGFFYQWTQNGIVIPNATNANYTANTTGNYQCIVTQNGCSNTSAIIAVTTIAASTVSISNGGPTTFCSGDNVILSAVAGTGYTYQWLRNGTIISGATSISYTATLAGNYTCRVSVSGSSVVSNAIAVTVNPSPTATIAAAGSLSVCAGDVVMLTANSGAGLTYQWFRNGIAVASATALTYNATTTGTYSCAVTLGSCTKFSNLISIVVNTPPAAAISASGSTNICAGGSVSLTANAGGSFSYQWMRNNTLISAATSINYSAISAGNYTCVVTALGCSDTSNVVNVIVNPLPTASISPNGPTTFCAGNVVVLKAVSNVGYTYQWRLNGANMAGKTADSLVVNSNGNYTCLVTANSCQNISNAINVTVNPVPVATITSGGPTTFFAGGSVVLTANSGSFTYQWLQNNNIIPGATSVTFNANTSGNYTCVLNQLGCLGTSNAIAVTVLSASLTNITANGSTTVCSGNTVELVATNNAAYLYQWQNNGVNIAGATSYNYFASGSGNYTCAITIAGSSATSNAVAVTVNTAPPAAVAPAGPIVLCAGSTAGLSANVGAGLTYQWQNNNINIGGATAANYTASSSGSYRCIVSQNGCPTTSAQVSVTVNPLPTASISAASSTTFFSGGSVVLNAAIGSSYTYQWQNNGVNISGATAASYTATAQGNYTCLVTRNGCQALSNVLAVTVTPSSGIVVTAQSATTFCAGGSVVLEATNGTGYTYQWVRNGVSLSGATNRTYTAALSGTYTCVVTYLGSSSTPNSVVVTVVNAPVVGVSPSGATTFCQGNSVTLNATPTGAGITYQWQRNGTNVAATNSNYLVGTSGNYQCIVTQNGCTATTTNINVVVNPIPTATISTSYATTFFSGDSAVLVASASVGYSYQWLRNGTPITNATNATYSGYVSGNYQCVITQNGCPNTSNIISLNVQPSSNISIAASGATTVCSGVFVPLSAPSGTGYTYQWLLNGANISGATNINYSAGTAGNYTCLVSLGGSSALSNAIAIVINPKPIVTITAGSATNFCDGNTVNLNANVNPAYTYQWQNNALNISGANSESLLVNTSGTYSCLVAQNGCADTSNLIPVTVRALPNAVVTPGGATTFFQGNSVSLIATAGTGYSYQWYESGNLIAGATNVSLLVTTTGNYSCIHTLNGCSATSLAISVAVLPISLASITNNGITSFCTGGSVELKAVNTAASAYQWQLNAANITGATTPNYFASATGTYTCLVTVSGVTTASNAINVTVNAPPAATVVPGGSTTFFAGGNVTLIANVGTYTYQWLLNGSPIAGANSFNFSANAAGNYTCVVSSFGCADTSALIAINVVPFSSTQISAQSSTNICRGDKVNLTVAGAGLNYQWKLNGVNIAGAVAQTYTASLLGIYSCDVSIGSSVVTSNPINVVVNVPPVASISISATQPVICSGSNLLISANGGGNYTYQWLYNSNVISTATNINYNATSAGSYSCIVAQNGCADTSTVIAATTALTPAASVGSNQNLCLGDAITLGAPLTAGNSYTWSSNPSGFSSSAAQITISPNTTTTYILTERTTATGCNQTNSVAIAVVPRADAGFSADTLSVLGDTLRLTNTTLNAAFCIWNYGDGIIDTLPNNVNPTHIYTNEGRYKIKLTTYGSTCPDTASIFVRITNKNVTPEFAMTVYPNPSKGPFVLKLDLDKKDDVVIGIFDDRGRLVRNIVLPQLNAGITEIPIDISGNAQGAYTLSVTVGKEHINKQKFTNGLPQNTNLKYQKFAKAVIQL